MAKITVDLEDFYGYSCGFQGHGSNETLELEISNDELAALKQIDEAEVSAEGVVAAIERGDSTLESLHEKLSDAFYNMVEEYWLFEAACNEFLEDNLLRSLKEDVNNGLYEATFVEDDDEDCDEDDEDEESNYDLEEYYEWVKEHDHRFIAERVGLDLDACYDDEVCYTIRFEE